ncbi:hypothetical protein [Rhizobium viscosum]|uniref:Uncharacterized protein n=1 Tax=Rhizobium viscosum TaxID=1673 RepID=A0ABR9IKV5_RHIVS|nr:hypothetical protein [Rhizobium viscosum]MBE1503815.1 hypothetical protein [Rhizobium viscosum]
MATETFLLKFLSPETGCSAHEMRFEAPMEVVAAILDVETPELAEHLFYLEIGELDALSSMLGLPFPEPDGGVVLTRPQWIDSVPYLVHTNFELALMLDGHKPFAMFSDEESSGILKKVRVYFQPYVDSGAIIERVEPIVEGKFRLVRILYALPKEEWRFDAYTELMRERRWTGESEYRLGRLLGYTEEQCQWWIAQRGEAGNANAPKA